MHGTNGTSARGHSRPGRSWSSSPPMSAVPRERPPKNSAVPHRALWDDHWDCPTGKSLPFCDLLSSPLRKNKCLAYFRKSEVWSAHPASLRGRFGRSSRHVRRGCGGRDDVGRILLHRRLMSLRTAKSCGPGIPTLMPSLRGARVAQVTVAKKPGAPGRARISRNTSRGECRLFRLNLWYLPPAFLIAGGPWVRPASGIPRALFASRGTRMMHHSGMSCREIAASCRSAVMRRDEWVV